MEHKKYTNITNDTRDQVLKLIQSNWSTVEITNLLGISKSAVNYIMTAYDAVANDNWNKAVRLMDGNAPSVKWAMDRLNKQIPAEYKAMTGVPETAVQETVVADTTNAEILSELKAISGYLAEIVAMLK